MNTICTSTTHDTYQQCLLESGVDPDLVARVTAAVDRGDCPRCGRSSDDSLEFGLDWGSQVSCCWLPICSFCQIGEHARPLSVNTWFVSDDPFFLNPVEAEDDVHFLITEQKRIIDFVRENGTLPDDAADED